MAVAVRSSTASSDPSRRPSRMLRVISRLRTARFVDLERGRASIGYESIDVLRADVFLGFVQVIDDRAGRTDGLIVGRSVAESEPFEIRGAEVF